MNGFVIEAMRKVASGSSGSSRLEGGDAPGPDGRVPVGEHAERQAGHAPAGAFLARERVDGCERAFHHRSLLPYRATVAAAVRVLPSRRAGVTESSESEVQ